MEQLKELYESVLEFYESKGYRAGVTLGFLFLAFVVVFYNCA